MLGSGLIGGLFVNPFKEKDRWSWWRLYDYEGNFERLIQLDVKSWVHEPNMGSLGYTHLVTPDGIYSAMDEYRVVRIPERFQP